MRDTNTTKIDSRPGAALSRPEGELLAAFLQGFWEAPAAATGREKGGFA